ncbi:MAG: LysM peptidoglycan-binding domain-containing protein [Gammaproteobacteria bacterium]
MPYFKSLVLALTLTLMSTMTTATELKPGHPDRYTVVKGDTLWDISAMFLNTPWLWPEIWHANPQVANPHLIYPGDLLTLIYIDGQPRLQLNRGYRTVKLSPQARTESLTDAIPTIPFDRIQQFLSKPLVVGKDELAQAAYVVSSAGEHLITGAGDNVYVRGLGATSNSRYNLFRPGDTYIDPLTDEILGYEAIYLGEGKLTRAGDPATMKLLKTTREIANGSRVLPAQDESINSHFAPHEPAAGANGSIIAVVDGVTQIGQYQVVVINRGARESIDVGTVFAVEKRGAIVPDRFSGLKNDSVKLPDEEAGLLMVFRVFEKVSYAVVMEATQTLNVGDNIVAP